MRLRPVTTIKAACVLLCTKAMMNVQKRYEHSGDATVEQIAGCFDAMLDTAERMITEIGDSIGGIGITEDAAMKRLADVMDALIDFGVSYLRSKIASDKPEVLTIKLHTKILNEVIARTDKYMSQLSEDLGLSAFETLAAIIYATGRFTNELALNESGAAKMFMKGYKSDNTEG